LLSSDFFKKILKNAKILNILINAYFVGGVMPKVKRYGARITVPLEDELLQKLDELSREKGVSIAGLVRMILKEWLAKAGVRNVA